ncbi:probable E3 ubiquitin-protein ligase bre1 [Cimex lectularius]|uniref:BRCT domain-containing protein n=1 Tax=Cimex lectularius TaxID=79782 RepID=A0A8I6RTR0_CIMLE|nr:probable E3 ubiquitin-protein ligase bre1 [Cimex lectularius]
MDQNAEEPVNPALFLSDEGFAISFHLILTEEEEKNALAEVIWNSGGRVEQEYCQMQPKTVLLVDQQTYENRNDFNRIAFKHQYINDCISKNELLNLTDYLYYKDVEDSPEYFLDVIYYRIRDFRHIEKFPDEKDNLYTVMSLSPMSSMGSPRGTSSSMVDSNPTRKMLLPLSFNSTSKGNKAFFSYASNGILQSLSSWTSPESISAKSKFSRSTSSNIALNCLLKTLNQSSKRPKVGDFKFHKISRLKVKSQSKEVNLLNKSNQDKMEDSSQAKTVSKATPETSSDSKGLQIENIENQENQQNINSNQQRMQKDDVNKILKTSKNNCEVNNVTKDKVLEKGKQKPVVPTKIRKTRLKDENNEDVKKIIKKKNRSVDNLSKQNKFTVYRNEDNSLQQKKLDQAKRLTKDCFMCNIKNKEKLKIKNTKANNLFKTDNILKTQLLANKTIPTTKLVRAKFVVKESIGKNKKKESVKSTSLLKQIGHASIRKKLKDSNLMNKSILSLRSSTNLMNRLENISRDSTERKPVNKSDLKPMQISLTKLKSKQNQQDFNTLKIYSEGQHKNYSKNKAFEEKDRLRRLIQHAINRRAIVRLTRIPLTELACSSGANIKLCSKSKEPPSMVTTRQAKRNHSQDCNAIKRKQTCDKRSTKMKISENNVYKNKLKTSNRFREIKKLQMLTTKTNTNLNVKLRKEKSTPKSSCSRKNTNGFRTACSIKEKQDSEAEKSKNKTSHTKIDKLQVKSSTKLQDIRITRSAKRLELKAKNSSKLKGTVPLQKTSLDMPKKKEAEFINAPLKKVNISKLTEKEIKNVLNNKDIPAGFLSILKAKNELKNGGLSRTVLKSLNNINNIKNKNRNNCKDNKVQIIKVLRTLRLLRRIALNSNNS